MTELKPCPFCGGEARVRYFDLWDDNCVYCRKCKASGAICDSAKDAMKAWNRRAKDELSITD